MKVPHRSTMFRRRVIPLLIAGVILCEAAPVALAQRVDTSLNSDATSESSNTSVLELFRGEVHVMRLPGTIKRIAIGNGKIVSASVVDGRLMLLAESAGVTSLVVWNEKGIALQTMVRVGKGEVNASVEQLRRVLQSVSGLRIQPVGPNIVLSGVVHRDMVPVIQSATADLSNVINTTTVDEGDALKKTIHFKVQIMEMTRTGQESLGIAWDSQFNGPQVGGQALFGTGGAAAAATGATNFFLAGIASNITSKINFAINNGDAYILATPELNTKSGGVATFLAGGEVPVPKAGALGTTDVDYKPYGIKLNIKPVVDANNIISASLETEISQIDPSVSYGGFPGFLTRKTTSDISLRAGETLAISGLVSSDALDSTNGMPFLGQLPIIGRLFRSDAFRSKKSDLVIFVTPLISDPSLSPNTDMLARADRFDQRFRDRYGDPSPLAPVQAEGAPPAPRQPVAPTPALPPAPVRNAPRQAAAPQIVLTPAPVPNLPPASNPIGLAEAIRMLDAPPVSQGATR
ncbi:type II and III secretion system protein family protein [Paraburkholderia gardini]|uniref:Type 3 secretion system secretin n=1 Tax=Paraburkholderia gardini TaxID=2823469 RepID=A0ABM8U3H4_9BURK|nr:pilus assembly protein N-terminal domain-containing protein [Paraburkholderia gardini]CAG4898164.1 Type 3 secretion system secretin [Paraburkholderia gardini]CAG4898661.1 Type 3 secretion system secretin [Paraburkholderia gardini]